MCTRDDSWKYDLEFDIRPKNPLNAILIAVKNLIPLEEREADLRPIASQEELEPIIRLRASKKSLLKQELDQFYEGLETEDYARRERCLKQFESFLLKLVSFYDARAHTLRKRALGKEGDYVQVERQQLKHHLRMAINNRHLWNQHLKGLPAKAKQLGFKPEKILSQAS